MAALSTTFTVKQGSTFKFSAVLKDETDTAIPAASLATLKLTFYDYATGVIINNRTDQNVLNANNVTVDSSGNLAWIALPDDSPIMTVSLPVELHVAQFKWTYGTKGGRYAFGIKVENLGKAFL